MLNLRGRAGHVVTAVTGGGTRPDRSRRAGTILWAVLIFCVGFTVDQLTKLWALHSLGGGTIIELVPTVRLDLFFNPGIAFGMAADAGPVLPAVLVLIIGALIGWIIWKIKRGEGRLGILLLTVVAAGAVGNLYDRIARADEGLLSGSVVDWIAVDWFAVFNAADMFTVCGMLAWVLTELLRPTQRIHDAGALPADLTGPTEPKK